MSSPSIRKNAATEVDVPRATEWCRRQERMIAAIDAAATPLQVLLNIAHSVDPEVADRVGAMVNYFNAELPKHHGRLRVMSETIFEHSGEKVAA